MNGHELRRILDIHETIDSIYRDARFSAQNSYDNVRGFAVTTMWVIGIEQPPEEEWYARVCELMPGGSDGVWRAIKADAPRYEPDGPFRWAGPCPAPMIRRDGPCGKTGKTPVRMSSQEDGTWTDVFYCPRHGDVAREVEARQWALREAGSIPVPMPNVGGLLPSYFGWDWPDQYARVRPGWKPPKVGIRADDWPVMAKVVEQGPPTLAVLPGDGEPGSGLAAPRLRLLPGGVRG